MDSKQVGNEGERLACDYISRKGARIYERNFHCATGEIDIIGQENEYLFFAEVKTRISNRCGKPYDAVTYSKQKKICGTALFYLRKKKIPMDTLMRFDVISVERDKIVWYRNAFEFTN